MRSLLLRFLALTAIALLIYLNIQIWQLNWLSCVALAVYFWFASEYYQRILIERFSFQPGVRSKIIGGFFAMAVFGFFAGIIIVFWRLDHFAIILCLLLSGCVGATIIEPKRPEAVKNAPENDKPEFILVDRLSYVIVFAVFVILAFFTLWFSRSALSAESPWQIIPTYYIYLYFLLVLLSGSLIYSKFRSSIIFVVITIQFLLAFSYLPMTHQLFWGADGWRHEAVIGNVVAEEAIQIKNFSENPKWLEKINLGIFSYSQFWGIIASASVITGAAPTAILSWLIPLLAGLLLPLLIYELGLALNLTKRVSLFFSWFGLFPFALQMVGAFTLPASFGFLFFLFFLLLIVKRAKENRKGQLPVLVGLAVLSLFGYALYALLIIFLFVAIEFLSHKKFAEQKSGAFALLIVCFIACAAIPLLEFIAGYARLNSAINYFDAIKQAVGNFSGYFLASGPRPHIIDTGNIFFNQIPSYAFVPNGFTAWNWWLIAFMILFFTGAFIGARQMIKEGTLTDKLLAASGIGLFLSYLITRYFLAGEHIISRRLDAVLAFFGILFVIKVLKPALNKNRIAAMFIILIVSIAVTASYSLGPFSRVMSVDEYRAASYVWSDINNDQKFCVIADTYPLLALEAISHKKVIGGGFPINENFAQPELNALYGKITVSSSLAMWQEGKDLTKADYCYLIAPAFESAEDIPLTKFGNLAVYRK